MILLKKIIIIIKKIKLETRLTIIILIGTIKKKLYTKK